MKPEILELLKLLVTYSQKDCLCSETEKFFPCFEKLSSEDVNKIKKLMLSIPYKGDEDIKRKFFNFPYKVSCVNADELVWAIVKAFA